MAEPRQKVGQPSRQVDALRNNGRETLPISAGASFQVNERQAEEHCCPSATQGGGHCALLCSYALSEPLVHSSAPLTPPPLYEVVPPSGWDPSDTAGGRLQQYGARSE